MKPVFKLSSLIVPIVGQWAVACLLGVLTVLSAVGLLMVSGWFITMAAWSGLVMAGSHAFNYLAPSAIIRTFAITRTAGRYGELMVSHQAIFELLKQLRVRFFEEFAKLDNHQRQQLGSDIAQYRLVKDIDTLNEFVLRFVNPWLIALAVGFVIAVILVCFISPLAIIPLIVAYASIAFLCIWAAKLAKKESDYQQQRQVWLTQRLFATTQLLVWGRWQALDDEFAAIDDKLSSIYRRQHLVRIAAGLWVQLLLILMVVAILLLAQGQHINPALLLAWVFGVFAMMEILANLAGEPFAYAKSRLAIERLNELLTASITTKKQTLPSDFDWQITQLSAKQPSAVFGLKDITITIKQGVPLVVQGVSGGGKSTLLDVMAGELKQQSGQMLLLGSAGECVDVSAVDWAGELGYLGQRVDIFDQSLADNLRLAKPCASDDELYEVLSTVGLDKWALSQPDQLNTALGEYGTAISGGQARRIALARLLLSPKKVLLLDEPFAGLDAATRHKIWQQLKHKQQQGILVVVSHHNDIIDDSVDCLTVGEPSLLV